jgi:hypothetical protein
LEVISSTIKWDKKSELWQISSDEEVVSLEEVVVSHAFEMMALITVLEKKGILSRTEILEEIKRMRKP